MSIIGYIAQRCKYVLPIGLSDGAPWFPGALSGHLPRLLVKSAPTFRSHVIGKERRTSLAKGGFELGSITSKFTALHLTPYTTVSVA